MKRTLFVFWMCLCCVGAQAQVTCEVRVDAHPHATTKQRVDYCLNSTAETGTNNPGLVFSGVSTYHPDEESTVQKPSARPGDFDQNKITVERTFVATRQFPLFTNETLSEREIWQSRQVAVEQPVQPVPLQTYQPVEKQMESLWTQVTETKAGLRARQTKPSRRLRISAAEEPLPAQTDLSELTTQQVAPLADTYTYDDATVQPYVPTVPAAQEYAVTTQKVEEYMPVEQADLTDMPVQEEIPVGTASYAPAN